MVFAPNSAPATINTITPLSAGIQGGGQHGGPPGPPPPPGGPGGGANKLLCVSKTKTAKSVDFTFFIGGKCTKNIVASKLWLYMLLYLIIFVRFKLRVWLIPL